MGNTNFLSNAAYQYRFHSENGIPKESLDENENIIVRYDGCCGWTISLTRSEDNTRKDCPHYSSLGYTTQAWTSIEFKTSEPLEFVTTWKDFQSTVHRYVSDPSYWKIMCTARECDHRSIENCSKGHGYRR
jgi:hypothetical protein